MSTTILVAILGVFGTSGLWTFITKIYDNRSKKQSKEQHKKLINEMKTILKDNTDDIKADIKDIKLSLDNNSELTMAISRDRINNACNEYLNQGFIPEIDYESFIAMGESYIKNDGNTIVKTKFEKCKDLPIKTRE